MSSKLLSHESGESTKVDDDYELARVKKDLYELPKPIRQRLHTSSAYVMAGVLETLRRDNLAMTQGAKADYLDVLSRHVTFVASGAEGTRDAVKRATREMADRGIRTVTYDNHGRQRRDKADVAIRRHLRTQITQATCKRTMDICNGAGCKFVEVSSHTGARPSHADWQGKVYSLTGATVVNGEEIADFYEATGYEGKTGDHASLGDRLGGINCRHSFAPWVPGMGHAYSETPDEDAGWNREEVYKDTQKQRALEADIRKNKRIAANEEASELEKAEAKAKIWNDQQKLRELTSSKPWLRRDASREKAPELDVQPRGAKNLPRATKHASERMNERGVTEEQIKKTIASPIKTFDVAVDDQGSKSQKIIGETTTVVINPETGAIITTYPTNRKMRRRYGANQKAGTDT